MSDEDHELSVDADVLFSKLERWKSDEGARASAAGETRQDIGQFIEDTGLNKKGLAMIRALDKMKDDKRADVLRSFDYLREHLDPKWAGQSTPDMFSDAVEPFDGGEEFTGDAA